MTCSDWRKRYLLVCAIVTIPSTNANRHTAAKETTSHSETYASNSVPLVAEITSVGVGLNKYLKSLKITSNRLAKRHLCLELRN